MKNHIPTRLVALGAVVLATACSDTVVTDPNVATADAPVPGVLTVSVVTPNSDDGAISIRVNGISVGDPVAVNEGDHLFFVRGEEGDLTVAVLAEHISGPVMQFEVPDVRNLGEYALEVVEVVSRSNTLRQSVAEYTLTVEAVKDRESQQAAKPIAFN